MENKELLDKTGIDESLYEFCYVKDGIVFPPLVENGKVIKTGLERYNDKFNKPIEKKGFIGKLTKGFLKKC